MINNNVKQSIEKSYLLFCHPRSGSHLLASLLASVQCGDPYSFWGNDIFSHKLRIKDATQFENYEDILKIGTSNNVWGGWVHWFHMPRLANTVKTISNTTLPFMTSLNNAFPNLQFIYLTRRDKFRQAISWAKHTGKIIKEEQVTEPPLKVDDNAIQKYFDRISFLESYTKLTEFISFSSY